MNAWKTFAMGFEIRGTPEEIAMIELAVSETNRIYREDLLVNAGLMDPLPRHIERDREREQRWTWEREYTP